MYNEYGILTTEYNQNDPKPRAKAATVVGRATIQLHYLFRALHEASELSSVWTLTLFDSCVQSG